MPHFCARKPYRIPVRERVLELGSRTLIMGILNVTPDSFSDGGQYLAAERAVARARAIAAEGADILDIGGESTRPDAPPVDAAEELQRVLPVLEALRSDYPIPISIDTSKADVARAALENGAVIVNDVTSLRGDSRIGPVAAEFGAGLILMHMRGNPGTMQRMPASPNILHEISEWAREAVVRAQGSGVSRNRIILDPGIGFGKTAAQNLEILRHLDRLADTGLPILVGTSRKSFIGAILNNPDTDRIWGTAATVAAAIVLGAHIVRVHDVAAMRDVVRMTDAIVGERPSE
jgi:dihydropteroate synthase